MHLASLGHDTKCSRILSQLNFGTDLDTAFQRQCHLSPPDGVRRIEGSDLINEEINAHEDDNRSKFLQRLQTMDNF